MSADTTGPAGTPGAADAAGDEAGMPSSVAGAPGTVAPGTPSGTPRLSGAAPGYRPHATLPLRVEAVRQLRRRRTLITFAVVFFLPVVIWAAFAIGGRPSGRENVPSMIDVATSSGLNFAFAVVFVSCGFLLTLPVALFFGDTVASEAGWSSLRYLLAAPVPRVRLLTSKALVAFGFSAAAVLVLPAVALGVGTIAYGWGDVQLPTGGTLPAGTAAQEFVAVALYVFVSQFAVAGLAFWLSTVTDAPLGAVGGAVGVTILSNILDAITALGSAREILPTHGLYAWSDILQPTAEWAAMAKGASVSLSYAIVFLALAFRGFRKKDIVS